MITVESTNEFGLVRRIFTHPDIYSIAAQDGAPAAEDFTPCEAEGIYYMVIREDSEPVGIWMLVPHSNVCYEIHTAILPHFRGRGAIHAAHLMAEWLWRNTPCLRLITNVPRYNRPAAMYSRLAGMKQFGVNEKSFMKDGTLHDQLMFGMSKPGV